MIWPRSAYCRAINWPKTRPRGESRCRASFSGRSQRGSKRTFRAAAEAHEPAVRLEDVAAPAHAHVVNHVQRQGRKRRLRGGGELQRRMDGMHLVGDDGQPLRLRAELPRDDVDFVSAIGQCFREAIGPLLQAAAERIEAFDDQPDSHSCTPRRRRIRFTRAATARMSRLLPGRSFGVAR